MSTLPAPVNIKLCGAAVVEVIVNTLPLEPVTVKPSTVVVCPAIKRIPCATVFELVIAPKKVLLPVIIKLLVPVVPPIFKLP